MSASISASNYLLAKLARREADGRPVRVGIVGAGDYALGLAGQLGRIPGAQASVICDLDPDAAARCYAAAGVPAERIVVIDRRGPLRDAVRAGRSAVTDAYELLIDADLDVIVDCTGEPEVGAQLAPAALQGGSHVVMVNVEADATVGTELAAIARRAGRVYTLADGDQPSLIVGLSDWASALGFEIVAVGKWTDAYSPDEAAARLASQPKPRKSDVTFLDGSKTQIELAAAANCLGLTVEPGGPRGPALDLPDIAERLRPDGERPLMNARGMCEYVDCRRLDQHRHTFYGGGVFVCARSDSAAAMRVMAAKGVTVSRDLTHAVFYRPYHLVGAETAWSILTAALEGRPTAQPLPERTVEVVAEAKREMKRGHVMDGLGGADVRGRAVPGAVAEHDGLVPFGLAAGCRLRRDVGSGEQIRLDSVEPTEGDPCWVLRLEAGSLPAVGEAGSLESAGEPGTLPPGDDGTTRRSGTPGQDG
jgi:predicted homoserine dehydrogenase-like protein